MNKNLIDFSDYIRYQCNWTKLRRGICGKIHVCYIDKTTYLCMLYFMLYRIENDAVYVDDIFYELQDYENSREVTYIKSYSRLFFNLVNECFQSGSTEFQHIQKRCKQ